MTRLGPGHLSRLREEPDLRQARALGGALGDPPGVNVAGSARFGQEGRLDVFQP